MNAHKTRLRAIVLCLLVCLGIVGLWAWSKREIYSFKHQYDNLTLAQLQEKTDILFPPSARVLRHSAIVGLSGEVRAKIAMNKKDASLSVLRESCSRNCRCGCSVVEIRPLTLPSPSWGEGSHKTNGRGSCPSHSYSDIPLIT